MPTLSTQGWHNIERDQDWTVPLLRGTIDVLGEALADLSARPLQAEETRDRYKAIIDDTPDDFAVRMLRLMTDMVHPKLARCVSCSEFPTDMDSNKVRVRTCFFDSSEAQYHRKDSNIQNWLNGAYFKMATN